MLRYARNDTLAIDRLFPVTVRNEGRGSLKAEIASPDCAWHADRSFLLAMAEGSVKFANQTEIYNYETVAQ